MELEEGLKIGGGDVPPEEPTAAPPAAAAGGGALTVGSASDHGAASDGAAKGDAPAPASLAPFRFSAKQKRQTAVIFVMNGMYTIGFIIWFSQFPFFFIERSCRRAGLPYPACCQPDQSAEEVFGIMDASGDCSVTREELAAHDTATDHYHLTPHSFDQIETADEGDEISLGE